MFSSAAHSVVYFARRTVFTTLCNQARFLSVSAVSSTKNLYSESVLFSEKQSKSAKAKKTNDKKFEQSQLYSYELEKLHDHDFEEFDLLMDDKIPSVQKDPRSVRPESVEKKPEAFDKIPSMQEVQRSVSPGSVEKKPEAFDKIPSMQEVQRSVSPGSVEKKPEAFDKIPSMQEVQGSVSPGSVAKKPEAVEELKISEIKEIYLQENDLDERLSDSDSENEAEAEDHYGMRKRVPNNFQLNLHNLKISRLGRRNKFLREKMEKAFSYRDELILNDEISGIFALAKLGVTPETLFFCSSQALKYFPADLSNTALYTVPFEDIKYWSYRVRAPETAMIGIYKKEDLKFKTSSSEPEMPLTIICDHVWHRLGFAQILSSAYVSPPKLFITSKECAYPWHGIIVRNSFGRGIFLNHDFGLTWEEIRQKVDENDRVYLLELCSFMGEDGGGAESFWPSLPSVNLYDHSFWDSENITVILTGSTGKKFQQELSMFCSERNASRIDTGVTNRLLGTTPFHMVFFELRRQWLAAERGNLSESGSNNGKTAKSRVRIVSTLFKT